MHFFSTIQLRRTKDPTRDKFKTECTYRDKFAMDPEARFFKVFAKIGLLILTDASSKEKKLKQQTSIRVIKNPLTKIRTLGIRERKPQ